MLSMVHRNYTKECGCSDIWPPSIFYGAYVQLEDCFTSYCQIKDSEERVCYKKKAEISAPDKNQLLYSRSQETLNGI